MNFLSSSCLFVFLLQFPFLLPSIFWFLSISHSPQCFLKFILDSCDSSIIIIYTQYGFINVIGTNKATMNRVATKVKYLPNSKLHLRFTDKTGNFCKNLDRRGNRIFEAEF